jgi:hypothetical protein
MKNYVLLSYANISTLPHFQRIYYLSFIYEYDVGLHTADEAKKLLHIVHPFLVDQPTFCSLKEFLFYSVQCYAFSL